MARRWRWFSCGGLVVAALVAACWAPAAAVAAGAPRVYIVLIDGLASSRFSEALTPALWELATGPGGRGAFYPEGRAVMPTVTNTNHASIATGTYAEAHGIVNNAFWSRTVPPTVVRSERAEVLQVETLFTVIERTQPRLRTAALFGKARLVPLFGATAVQRPPDVLWGDQVTESEAVDRNRGFASDRRTMDEVLRLLAGEPPDFMFVGLPDVDRTSHLFGPDSHEARRAVLEADRQVARLVRALKRGGAWGKTVLIVTADHGFADVAPNADAGRPYPVITMGPDLEAAGGTGVGLLGIGGLELVALPRAGGTSLSPNDHELLAEIRRRALAHAGVEAAWYRVDNPADGGAAHTLARMVPDWRLEHPGVGDLVLVGRPGFQFVDPYRPSAAALLGMHGGPDVQKVAIVVTGGHPRLRAQRATPGAEAPAAANPDLGATAAWLLDVRAPRTIAGKTVPARDRGRVLQEAFVP